MGQSSPSYPPEAGRHLALAAHALRAGRAGDAIPHLEAACRLAPGDAAILHDLGLARLETGRLGEAILALRGAVSAGPRYADAHLRLGIALEAAGDADAALAAYRRACDIDPKLADGFYRAGDLLDGLGHPARAATAFRRAAAASRGTTLGRIALAKALLAEERHGAAETVLREALAAAPDQPIALELLAGLLAETGRLEAARDTWLQAIRVAPLRAGSYDDIVRCRRIGPGDAGLIADMRAALAQQDLEAAPRARVHLALGNAAADLGDAATAMLEFGAAQAIRDRLARFDLGAFEARVDRMIGLFTPSLFAAAARPARKDAMPIFIVGLPRSGTTLVEHILAAHPEVAAGGELPFWNERGQAWEQGGAAAPAPALLSRLAADCLALLRRISPTASRVTDKMPLNFQWAGLIHLALPGATILHCRRAPIDTALSIHRTHFNPHMPFPTGGEALVSYIRAYQRLCAHWGDVLPADRFVDIDYESLTGDPEGETRRILATCGLPWRDECLHPERQTRAVRTPSKWQVRQPIYRHAVDGWRIYEPWLGALRDLAS